MASKSEIEQHARERYEAHVRKYAWLGNVVSEWGYAEWEYLPKKIKRTWIKGSTRKLKSTP